MKNVPSRILIADDDAGIRSAVQATLEAEGYEVACAFRADETFKSTFLVALSGYALPEDLQRATQAGFHRHLAKPPSLEMIEELLGNLPTANNPHE